MAGFFGIAIIYALVLVLYLAVPARETEGYVRDSLSGKPLRYHLNGLRVLFVVLALYFVGGAAGLFSWDVFYLNRWGMVTGACFIGLVFTLALVLPIPRKPGSNLFTDLYLGRLPNPQWAGGRFDAKMFLYLVGAVMLELNVLSFCAHHILTHKSDVSPGAILCAAFLTFFVAEYLHFEKVHLYTYDFIAERVGFKLGWGCLAFYPFFYCVGLWSTAELPNPHTPAALLVFYGALFFLGWFLSRGANLQKYFFKTQPEAPFLGFFVQRSISDGKKQLLCNGFWGLSRHINYLGEILMALGLTLALGHPTELWPWLYPLYYVVLLVPRQLADDKLCAEKYGSLWREYCQKVPYRIVPWVY